jgi:hypothetical protein
VLFGLGCTRVILCIVLWTRLDFFGSVIRKKIHVGDREGSRKLEEEMGGGISSQSTKGTAESQSGGPAL